VARYAADLHGGFSSFAVYAKGLTEEVILGNSLSSLLRIVAVDGNNNPTALQQKYGALVEKTYDSPMYVKVLPREINEIEIEIRTMTGQFVPFQFGNVTVTLVFRKVINL
jgi:hypothetical protein